VRLRRGHNSCNLLFSFESTWDPPRSGAIWEPTGKCIMLLNRGTCIWRLCSWECTPRWRVCYWQYKPKGGNSPLGCWHWVASTRSPSTSFCGGPSLLPWSAPTGVTQVVLSLDPSLTMGFHGWMRRERDGDRAGPRRVFIISSNLQYLVVSFNLFRILFEYCNFTALT
jgi:hypothetical protein